MFGKLIRWIFLDKQGRETWSRIEAGKQRKKGGRPRPAAGKTGKAQTAISPPARPSQAKSQLPRKLEQLQQAEMTLQDQLALVQSAIDTAHQEMGLSPPDHSAPPGHAAPPARPRMSRDKEELIHAAMTVYRTKKAVLDELSPEDRAKLKALAQVMLGGGK